MGCGASKALQVAGSTARPAPLVDPSPAPVAAQEDIPSTSNQQGSTEQPRSKPGLHIDIPSQPAQPPSPQPITLLPPISCVTHRHWPEVQKELTNLGLLRTSPSQAQHQTHMQLQGVSPAFLHHFSTILDPTMTAAQVIADIILPALNEAGCPRFVELLVPEHTLPATCVVSHWRGAQFKATLAATCHHLATVAAKDLRAAGAPPSQTTNGQASFIDVFCSQHHAPSSTQQDSTEQFMQEMTQAVECAGSSVLVLSDSDATAFTRLWAIWEVMQTAGQGASRLHIAGPPSFSHVTPQFPIPSASGTSAQDALQVLGDGSPHLTLRSIKSSVAACVAPRDELHVSRAQDAPALLACLQALGVDLDAAGGDPGSLQSHLAVALKSSCEEQVQLLMELAARFQKPAVPNADALERSSDSRLSRLEDGQQQQRDSTSGAKPPGLFDHDMVGALRVSDGLMTAGLILQALHCWDKSEVALRRCLQLRGKVLGGASLPTARAYVALGRVLVDSSQEVLAEPMMRKGIAHLKTVLGKQHAEVGDATSSLGVLLVKQGQVQEAEQALRHALKVQSAARGGDHPASWTTAAHLAAVYRDQGRMEEAANLYQPILAAQVQAYGLLHSQVATTAGHLAWVLQVQGRREEALPLAQQAAQGMLHAHGPLSGATGAAKANLGHLLIELGRTQDAYNLLQESLDILLATRGETHPDTQAARQHVFELEQHMMKSKSTTLMD